MGWILLEPAIHVASTNSTTKKESVYPTFYARRSEDTFAKASPPLDNGFGSNYGRMGTVNIATAVSDAYNDVVGLLGSFGASVVVPVRSTNSYWDVSMQGYNNNGNQLDTYLLRGAGKSTTTTEVLAVSSASSVLLNLRDTTYLFEFHASDIGFPVASNGTSWDTGADDIYQVADIGTDAATLLVSHKTAPGVPILPQLIPRLIGATFVDFYFPVNVMTNESSSTVTLHWRRGTSTSTTTSDGSVTVSNGERGEDSEYYTASATGLLPNTPYTFWITISRGTVSDTTATGPVSFATTEASDTYTYDTAKALVSITTDPTIARFGFSLDVSRIQRAPTLFTPATWIEAIDVDDFNSFGWSDPFIFRSSKVGPFYPQQTFSTASIGGSIIYVGRQLDAAASSRASIGPTTVTGTVSGKVDITDLVQSNTYMYRLALDWPSGREYPLTGEFSTPNLDPARQTISTHFTLGGF